MKKKILIKQKIHGEGNDIQEEKDKKVTKADVQNIKKFLIEEYGVSEKCLKIN